MKNRNRLVTSMVLVSISLFIVICSMVITNYRMKGISKQKWFAESVKIKTAELGLLFNNYWVNQHREHIIENWESLTDSVIKDLSNISAAGTKQQALVDKIKANQQILRSIFKNKEFQNWNAALNRGSEAEFRRFWVLRSRIDTQIQGILFDISRLSLMLNSEAENLKRFNILLILSLTVIFIIFLIINYLLLFRRVEEVIGEGRLLFDILEMLPAYVVLLDKDYHVSYANNYFRKHFGESQGRCCFELLFQRNEPCEDCETYKVLETKLPHRWTWIGPDGRNYDIYDYPFRDAKGSPVILEMGIDVTERKKAEQALVKERELLMITLNSLTEGVIAADPDDRIFLINEAALSLTGFSRTEAVHESLSKILYLIDDQTSEPVNPSYLNLEQFQKLGRQLILVTKDLKEVPVSVHISPIKSANDGCIGTVTVFRDITEKLKTEQELFKAAKLESLGILAGGIAHDFNNFLTAILSNLQLAQIKYAQNENIEKYLRQSMESTYRASELTRQLLTFSKGGAPVKKAASIIELIHDTAKFALRGSKVKVICHIPKTLWPVEVDTGQISQVIHNLAINAKQAMPKGGIVEIRAENTVIDNQRFKPGNYIKISFKDQGIGIAREDLPKIFDPYFTTKKEGSGLGLATSYSIIRKHDGYIEVESERGKGTTFYIYLPALVNTETLPETQNEPTVNLKGLRILLMDDEETILKTVSELLEMYGHEVTTASDGEKAIDAYLQGLQSGSPFDLVIMDLTVPGGMGGQEAIAHLRDVDPNIKAIVSSGYANELIIMDYERFGFCGVMTKPYKIEEINKVINQVINSKQLTGVPK